MTSTPTGIYVPFALARFLDGDAARLGIVAGDRIRRGGALTSSAPSSLNALLAAPDWDRLDAAGKNETDGCSRRRHPDRAGRTPPGAPDRSELSAHVIDLVAAGPDRKRDPRPEDRGIARGR